MIELFKAVPVLSKLFDLDTDIPEMERIENQYKLDRKKSLLIGLCFVLYIIITNTSVYYMYDWVGNLSLLIPIVLLVLVLILSFANRSLLDFSKVYMPLVLSFIMNFLFTVFLFVLYYDGFSIWSFLVAVLCISMNYIFYWSIFQTFKNQFTLRKNHDLLFVLVGGEVVEAKLISITKRGDYIVEIPDNEDYKDSEVLLNRLEIQKIIYRKEVKQKD